MRDGILTNIFILLPYLGGVFLILFNISMFKGFTEVQFIGTIVSYFIIGILGIIDWGFELKIGQGVKFHGTK